MAAVVIWSLHVPLSLHTDVSLHTTMSLNAAVMLLPMSMVLLLIVIQVCLARKPLHAVALFVFKGVSGDEERCNRSIIDHSTPHLHSEFPLLATPYCHLLHLFTAFA